MRLLLVSLVVLLGCRGGFDASMIGDGVPDSGVEPPLPVGVCARSVLKIPGVSAGADLAVTSRATGYVIAWADSATGVVTAASVDLNRRMIGAPVVLVDEGATALPGLEAAATRVWMVVSSGSLQSLYSMEPDLTASTLRLAEPSVAGFSPIGASVEPASVSPVWVRASVNEPTLRMAYLPSTGAIGTDSTFATNALVTSLSVADYKDHVHLGWREASGTCLGVDVRHAARPEIVGAPTVLSNDCASLRVVSGPAPYDPLVSTWVTGAGVVQVSYVGAGVPTGGTYFQGALARGRAPKITFDGTGYWVAWADLVGLRFARVEKNGVAAAPAEIPGVTQVSDEGFELVRRGTATDLVILEKASVTFLTLCSPP
jgi:hypothetical protein